MILLYLKHSEHLKMLELQSFESMPLSPLPPFTAIIPVQSWLTELPNIGENTHNYLTSGALLLL